MPKFKRDHILINQVLYITENGLEGSDLEKVHKNGLMEQCITVNGNMDKLAVKEHLLMLMEINIWVLGDTIKQMDLESIIRLKE